MDVFDALADPVRRAVLIQLCDGPRRVADLAAGHDISRPAISRHLRVLAEAGLVSVEVRGRERHYRLEPEGLVPVRTLLRRLAGTAPRFGASVLDALDLEVRRAGRDRRARSDHHRQAQEETA